MSTAARRTSSGPVREKIDLFISFGADNKSLIVTVHYYDNNTATNDARLFAYVGTARNPAEASLEGLLDKDGIGFDLFTQSNGIATSEVLLEHLPSNFTLVSVVGPHGLRVKKELTKVELKTLREFHGGDKTDQNPKKDLLLVEALFEEKENIVTARGTDYPFRIRCFDKKGNGIEGEVLLTATVKVSLLNYESDASIAVGIKKYKLSIPKEGLLLLVKSKAISDVQVSFLYGANKPVTKTLRKDL